jgi:peroxiredoxin
MDDKSASLPVLCERIANHRSLNGFPGERKTTMPALFFPKFSKVFGMGLSRPGWAAIHVVCWTWLWCGLVVGQATDQTPSETNQAPNENVRKEAEEILEKVFENCKRLSSYRATVRRTSSDFTDSDSEVMVRVKDRNRIEVRMRTNDGEWYGCSTPEGYFSYTSKDPSYYLQHALPSEVSQSDVTVAGVAGKSRLYGWYFVLNTWAGYNPVKSMAEDCKDITVEHLPDKPLTKVTLILKEPEGRVLFTVNRERNELLDVRSEIRPQGSAPKLFTETVTAFEPLPPDEEIAFVPPPGARRIDIAPPPPRYNKALKPDTAPFDFKAKDLDGKSVSLKTYKGKVLLLDFWATWCGPCKAELPKLREAYEKYKDQGFDILSISLDEGFTRESFTSFVRKERMNWRHIYDGQGWKAQIATQYGVRAIPFTLLIGRDGKIAAVDVRGEKLEPAIQAALAK